VGLCLAGLAHAQPDLPQKFQCVVKDAQILADRTQVRCANKGMNGLSEFAAETNQPYANRVASAIVQALRTSTPLVLTYAPSIELNPEGCSERNCRKIIDVGGSLTMPRQPQAPVPREMAEPQIEPSDVDLEDTVVQAPAPPPRQVPQAPQPIVAPAAQQGGPAPAFDPYRMRPVVD
jgi:hypothetical protein